MYNSQESIKYNMEAILRRQMYEFEFVKNKNDNKSDDEV